MSHTIEINIEEEPFHNNYAQFLLGKGYKILK